MSNTQKIKVAVDAIVFGYESNQLFVLLIKQKYGKFKGQWVLPGGFVLNNEGLTNAVNRELKEEAGIEVNYLEQLYTFGDDTKRDPRGHTISVAYFALVNPENLNLIPDTDASDAKWFPIDEIEKLPFDHNKIIDKALERLKAKLHYQPIGFDLLNKEFPFSDLEQLYMCILEKKFDRRNFRKKILSLGFLNESNKIQKKGSGRPAKLFSFDRKNYKAMEKQRFHFEIKFVK